MVYIVISFELLNKTVIVLLGAMVFIALHIIGQEEAFRSIDWNVIFLLISMMVIGSAARLDFLSFLVNLTPIVLIVFLAFIGIVYLLFHKELVVTNERRARVMEFDESKSIEDPVLLKKCLSVLGGVIVGFLFHGMLQIEAATVSMLGASILLLLTGKHEVDDYFKDIEWGTIFFFIGLFILVGGIVELGIIRLLAAQLLSVTRGNLKLTAVILIWVSGAFSAIVDNIPYVATLIPLIQNLASSVGQGAAVPLWWSLALGACLGGNGTLVGASANVIAAGLAGKSGYKITFLDFTRYGILVTLVSLLLSTVYVLWRYF